MTDKSTWKKREMKIARDFGTKRNPLIRDIYNFTPSTFDKLLSYMQSLDKTNTHQKPSSYRHAIDVFELPSWMELRSEVKN